MMAQEIKGLDPRTGETVGRYRSATTADVHSAAAAAAVAHRSSVLAPLQARGLALRTIADRLESKTQPILSVCSRETALPDARLRSEWARTLGQLRSLADTAERGMQFGYAADSADPSLAPPRPDLLRTLVPIGPVAVFGASNFPLAFGAAGGDTASALAAGCPVVIKGHPLHPGTSTMLAETMRGALRSLGWSEDIVQHVLTADATTAAELVSAPGIAAVAFTGSTSAGLSIARRARSRSVPIPVYAEMGSINPAIATSAAAESRADAIAMVIADAVTAFGGQLCTKPGLLMVPAGAPGESLISALTDRMSSSDPMVLVSPSVKARYQQASRRLHENARVSTLVGPSPYDGPASVEAQLFRTDARQLIDNAVLFEECFGPALLVATYTDRAELARVIDVAPGQLCASVFSEPGEKQLRRELVAGLQERCGRIVFDAGTTGVAVAPAMHHGGPHPATTSPLHTSVGSHAVLRFLRPVTMQDAPTDVTALHPFAGTNDVEVRRDGELRTEGPTCASDRPVPAVQD